MAGPSSTRTLTSDAFHPSIYSALKSSSTSASSEALASGTTRINVTNVDGTNYVRVAMGAGQAAAEASVGTGGVVVMPGQSKVLGVPDEATWVAWIAAAGTPQLEITQGG